MLSTLLERAGPYLGIQRAVGLKAAHQVLLKEYVRPSSGDRVLDLGCGPGALRSLLPEVNYLGIDPNPTYIASALKFHGPDAPFRRAGVEDLPLVDGPPFDLIIASGLLHHLNDELASQLFVGAHQMLRSGGRLVTFDGCLFDGQSALSRWLVVYDRGGHGRQLAAYAALARPVFSQVEVHTRELLRVPYTHCILECMRAPD